MDKKTEVKRLRVRGLPAVAYFARLKAIAVNLFRATAVWKAIGLSGEAIASAKSGIRYTIVVFKKQFLKHMGRLANIFTLATDEPRYERYHFFSRPKDIFSIPSDMFSAAFFSPSLRNPRRFR